MPLSANGAMRLVSNSRMCGAVPPAMATVQRSYEPGVMPPMNAASQEMWGCFSLARASVCSQFPNSP